MHTVDIVVRSYEMDVLGHVNNAVYLNYFEHGRVTLMNEYGVDFAELREQGRMMVLAETSLKYRAQSFMGDHLVVASQVVPQGIRLMFHQRIVRKSDQRLIAEALNTIVMLNERGRPTALPESILKKLL